MSTPLEGSHVHWPSGYDDVDDSNDDAIENINRMRGKARGKSGMWEVRFPNDRYVADEAVTLEQMREAGAV